MQEPNQLVELLCSSLFGPGEGLRLRFAGALAELEKKAASASAGSEILCAMNSAAAEHIVSGEPGPALEKAASLFTKLGEFEDGWKSSLAEVYGEELVKAMRAVVDENIPFDKKTCASMVSKASSAASALASALAGPASGKSDAPSYFDDPLYGRWRKELESVYAEARDSFGEYFGRAKIIEFSADFDVEGAPRASFSVPEGLRGLAANDFFSILKMAQDQGRLQVELGDGVYLAVCLSFDFPSFRYVGKKRLLMARSSRESETTRRDSAFAASLIRSFRSSCDSLLRAFESDTRSEILADAVALSKLSADQTEFQVVSNIMLGLFRASMNCRCGALLVPYSGEEFSGWIVSSASGYQSGEAEKILETRVPLTVTPGMPGGPAGPSSPADCRGLEFHAEPPEFLKFLAPREGSGQMAVCPLFTGGKLHGVLVLFARPGNPFDAYHEAVLSGSSVFMASALFEARGRTDMRDYFEGMKSRQEQLVNTEKLKLLSEISAGIVHNFNNLMAIVLGRVGIMQRVTNDSRILSSLKAIEDTVREGENITRRFKSFISGSRDSSLTLVNVNDVIAGVVEIARMRLKGFIENAGVNISVETELSAVPEIFARAEDLSDAFVNIVFNSIDALPKGGRIVITSCASAGKSVRVAIRDNGIGMSSEVIGKLFIPFFTTKGRVGTGLGLPSAYGIVSRHGGTIEVKSEVGKGSEFIVTLPAGRPKAAPAQ